VIGRPLVGGPARPPDTRASRIIRRGSASARGGPGPALAGEPSGLGEVSWRHGWPPRDAEGRRLVSPRAGGARGRGHVRSSPSNWGIFADATAVSDQTVVLNEGRLRRRVRRADFQHVDDGGDVDRL